MSIHETLAALTIPLGSVTRYPGNARAHQIDRLRESLRNNQQYRPIVVNRRTMQILAGNGTHEAAEAEGWSEIAATFVDVDDEQAQRILLVDNPPPSHPGYDDALLLELLQGLPDIGGTGWTSDELAELEGAVRGEQQRSGFTDPDEVPEPPVEPVTRPGDLWLLGGHRLLCGSATKREDIARLLDGARPDVMVTDPPYGVAFGSDKSKNAIHGDISQAVTPVAFALAMEVLADNARVYMFGGSTNLIMYAGLFDAHLRMQVRPIVWDKEQFVLRPNNYHSQWELVCFGWKGNGGAATHWYGDRTASDVWRISRRLDDRLHSTQKPVEVCAIPIRNSCPPQGLVFEPFAGSGSTLIAAHSLGRACLALELDPSFCDVVARRYQEHTGEKPILEATGEPHDFTDLTRGA